LDRIVAFVLQVWCVQPPASLCRNNSTLGTILAELAELLDLASSGSLVVDVHSSDLATYER
jgi:hypothetical protein